MIEYVEKVPVSVLYEKWSSIKVMAMKTKIPEFLHRKTLSATHAPKKHKKKYLM